MKSISIDFNNKSICIMSDGQQGTMYFDIEKDIFKEFIPEKFMDYTSYTWNFENDTFAVNQKYILSPGAIMTDDCFIPQCIIPMPKLHKKFDKFIKLANLEVFNAKDILDELPDKLKNLLKGTDF